MQLRMLLLTTMSLFFLLGCDPSVHDVQQKSPTLCGDEGVFDVAHSKGIGHDRYLVFCKNGDVKWYEKP